MAILREFRCTFHEEEFESFDERPACPFGCDPAFVVLEFRTAPRIRHAGTGIQDMLTRQLAADYNMTDVRGDKEGTSVMSNTPLRSGGARAIGDQGKPYWGGHFAPQRGWAQRQEPTPAFKAPSDWTQAAVPIKSIQEGASNHLRKATAFIGPKPR